MKHHHLLGALGAALLVAGASGCKTSSEAHNHWHIDSVGSSFSRAFFGTVPEDYTVFKEEAGRNSRAFGWTLRRHFLSDNPGNPLQPQSKSREKSPPMPPTTEFTVSDPAVAIPDTDANADPDMDIDLDKHTDEETE